MRGFFHYTWNQKSIYGFLIKHNNTSALTSSIICENKPTGQTSTSITIDTKRRNAFTMPQLLAWFCTVQSWWNSLFMTSKQNTRPEPPTLYWQHETKKYPQNSLCKLLQHWNFWQLQIHILKFGSSRIPSMELFSHDFTTVTMLITVISWI